MNLKETYNRIAEDWHRDHQSDDWWIEGTDRFISLLPPGGSVLDVGCGGGTKAKYLARRGFGVTGIDLSKRMIGIARREAPEGTFLVLDLWDLDTLEETFDGVFAQAVLPHLPKARIPDALRLIADRVKSGIVYAAVKERKPGQPEEVIEAKDNYGYRYERFFSYFTLPELSGYCRTAGLAVISEDAMPSGNTRWLQVMARKGS